MMWSGILIYCLYCFLPNCQFIRFKRLPNCSETKWWTGGASLLNLFQKPRSGTGGPIVKCFWKGKGDERLRFFHIPLVFCLDFYGSFFGSRMGRLRMMLLEPLFLSRLMPRIFFPQLEIFQAFLIFRFHILRFELSIFPIRKVPEFFVSVSIHYSEFFPKKVIIGNENYKTYLSYCFVFGRVI